MKIKFEKYQGLGNDFIFISEIYLKIFKTVAEIQNFSIKICDRHYGIGADGVIFVQKSKKVKILIVNSDGSFAATCGNALRCLGLKLWRENFWNGKRELSIYPIDIEKKINSQSRVYTTIDGCLLDANKPIATLARVFFSKNDSLNKKDIYTKMVSVLFDLPKALYRYDQLPLDKIVNKFFVYPKASLNVIFVQLENPHLVFYSPEFELFTNEQFIEFGKFIQAYINVNVGMLCLPKSPTDYLPSANCFVLKVYERGAGLTRACGSGAVAAAAALKFIGCFADEKKSDNTIQINMPGGLLEIQLPFLEVKKIVLSAKADFVFNGALQIQSMTQIKI